MMDRNNYEAHRQIIIAQVERIAEDILKWVKRRIPIHQSYKVKIKQVVGKHQDLQKEIRQTVLEILSETLNSSNIRYEGFSVFTSVKEVKYDSLVQAIVETEIEVFLRD